MKALVFLTAPLLIGAAPPPVLAPSEIVAAAPGSDWVDIAVSDLLMMELSADTKGRPRRIVIQLMPPPFSQGWVGNIRKLAAARWWDGTTINRVQDNYVVQWGDPNAEDKGKAKGLPKNLAQLWNQDYVQSIYPDVPFCQGEGCPPPALRVQTSGYSLFGASPYAAAEWFELGWQIGSDNKREKWPIHCYGMIGAGRDMPPDKGTGAELYVVIGHAPRHLDRNIALVGRVIEGIEHLSSLPRGTGALGFYETPAERTPIVSIRSGSEVTDLPRFQYLSTESATFARYADARANRRDPFFVTPAGGADICNIPVPIRRAP